MTKIDIFSGFLGAGKTTLIKKLLKEALSGEKVVLIENEFGEIGIDGGFMKEAGIQVTEMNSGCICCSLVGDFGKALRQVIDQYHPDRILIEPSGVGKLSDVIRAVEGVEKDIPEAEMGSFVTVADAGKCRMYVKNFGEFFLNQIEYAGTILLSRTQGMSQEKLEAVVALLREHNAKARIITTPWDEISGETILAAMQDDHDLAADMLATVLAEHHDDDDDDECCHHHHHDHDDDDDECCHHHHHHDHDDDDEEDEHEHHHHDHDDDDEDEHEHHHHDHEDEASTIIMMMRTACAAAAIIITTITATTRTRYLSPGARRRCASSVRTSFPSCSLSWTAANMALCCARRASFPAPTAAGFTLTTRRASRTSARVRRTTLAACA